MAAALNARIGFIGGGAMASALMGGLVKAGAASAAQIHVSEPYIPLREKHHANGYRATASNRVVVQQSDMVWLAVKPDTVLAVLAEVADLVTPQGQLFVSICAGIDLRALESMLPAGARVVRVMPNLPCLVSETAAAFCRGTAATDQDAELVRDALRTVGQAEEVPEKLMDAVTGLSGSGPAYGFLMIEALADGGVRAGLPRDVALRLAAQTLKGAAAMILETGKHPGVLKDQVCSPGGTTIAGVAELEAAGFRSAVMRAVAAATARSKEMSVPQPKPQAKL